MLFAMQERGDPDNDVMYDLRIAYRSKDDYAWLWRQVRRPIKPLLAVLAFCAIFYISKKVFCKYPTAHRQDMSTFYMTQLYKTALPHWLKKEIKSFYGNLSSAYHCGRGEGETT